METLIVHTVTNEDLKVVKGIMQPLKVKYEESPYNAEFIAKIENGKTDVENGRTTKISLDEIWKYN